jgi:SAM-dependent methyltransferase
MKKTLRFLRKVFNLTARLSKKAVCLINGPLFYLEKTECQTFSDCKLLAKVLYQQPPNSDRNLEYPWLLENIKISSGRILDVGSTASDLLYDFLPKTIEINSIDLNSKPIKNEAVKFSVGDIRQTAYADNYFDIVSCISTLEHIGVTGRYGSDYDEQGDLKAVMEMARILKPSGTLLVTVPYGSKDVLPLNKLYNKERIAGLFKGFSSVEVEYKKYFSRFQLWLSTTEAEAAKTDMINDLWYAIAFIKAKK